MPRQNLADPWHDGRLHLGTATGLKSETRPASVRWTSQSGRWRAHPHVRKPADGGVISWSSAAGPADRVWGVVRKMSPTLTCSFFSV